VCPDCGSRRNWRDGWEHFVDGRRSKQRRLCRDCGLRFVPEREKNGYKNGFSRKQRNLENLNINHHKLSTCQVSAILQEAKNLSNATETKTVAGESQKADTEAQIVKYLIHLKNSGRREATIEARDQQLKRLLRLGADLNDGESVKGTIASLDRTESYKALLCIAYEGFARKNGIPWTRPNYKQSSPLPFVPHESEVDALISGSGKKTATLLRLLKETAMRLGEAWLVEWIDIDSQNHTVMCRNPEKNSRPRAFEISAELSQMLQSLPHNSQYIFSCSREPLDKEDRRSHLNHLKRQKGLLGHQRRRTAEKLKNPCIAEIKYHSLRHWKATQLYHQTKDILYVMKFLGHRDVKNTLIYIDLESVCYSKGGEDYHAKTAKTETEAIQLVEAGFEYVCDIGEVKLFRKRK